VWFASDSSGVCFVKLVSFVHGSDYKVDYCEFAADKENIQFSVMFARVL
jgi:hypothetical protein